MNKSIDCFLPYGDFENVTGMVAQLRQSKYVRRIFLLSSSAKVRPVEGCRILLVDNLKSAKTMREIALAVNSSYAMLCFTTSLLKFSYMSVKRMVTIAAYSDADFVYSDRNSLVGGEVLRHPTIDYQLGSVRDDFDFGPVCLVSAKSLKAYSEEFADSAWEYAGWYEYRLYVSRLSTCPGVLHINEFLYTEPETDLRKSGDKQFDYVDPSNRLVQIEMEKVCTEHLKRIDAYIKQDVVNEVSVQKQDFDKEASVIIPVRNRVRTIGDAVRSALSQKTGFDYNVIVVDNHSDDGTSLVIEKICEADSRCIHIVPECKDLGIGGCWNLAVNDSRCGRFAVQLDSDDLYSSENTLQRIVDKFNEEHCAMVIGAYRICDFDLNTLPPGLIDHKEWTDENGPNNALRINGLGAPRAFFTPMLRKMNMPNTCYGEDYSVALRFSRLFKVGRIYDELYLCRRWEGNSDAALSQEKVNANNHYKDSLRSIEIKSRQSLNAYWRRDTGMNDALDLFDEQLVVWPEAAERYHNLENAVVCDFDIGDFRLAVQHNPSRATSTCADVDKESISKRPCFLCDVNRPEEQLESPLSGKYYLLVNPYPILPKHFTIPLRRHKPQLILENYEDMMKITQSLSDMFVFYNGPMCGASAPDHMHFQAGSRGVVPVERDWNELYRGKRSRIYPISEDEFLEAIKLETMADDTGIFSLRDYVCPGVIIVTRTPSANAVLFRKVYDALPLIEGEAEPRMNILSWTMNCNADGSLRIVSLILPRSKHRPDCYYAEGEDKILVSPGALDMGGLLITPREEDFKKITPELAASLIREVAFSLDDELQMIKVLKNDF